MKAICISCGARKRAPFEKCRRCGFDPNRNDTDLVKSVYLSTARYITGEETEEEVEQQSKYSEELDKIARIIEGGHHIDYDQEELTRLRGNLELMRSVPLAAVRGAVGRLFMPALVLGGILLLLIVVLRLLLFFKG